MPAPFWTPQKTRAYRGCYDEPVTGALSAGGPLGTSALI